MFDDLEGVTVITLGPIKADPEKVKELTTPFKVDYYKLQDFMDDKATITIPDNKDGEPQHLILLAALSIFARGFILYSEEELKMHIKGYNQGIYTDYQLYVANTETAKKCLLPEGQNDTTRTSIRPKLANE